MTEPVDLAQATSRVVVARDGEEFVLGRPDLGVYVVVPVPGAVLLQALQAGEPLPAATARASEVAGTDVDGEDFVSGLAAAGLLRAAGGRSATRRQRELRWIEGVSPAAARRLFGPVAWACYGVAAGFAVATLAARPDLRPTFEHWGWLPDPVLSVLIATSIGLLLAGGHEAWHWLAGRAIGVPAIFRVSYRGIFLVFETDLTQIVTLPRRRRYGPFLAGMAFDGSVLAVALGLRLAQRVELFVMPGWVDRLLAMIVLIQVLRIVWQWTALVLRSDGYAVVANALRCHDLHRTIWLTTKDRMWGLTAGEAADLANIGEPDRRVGRWFGVLFLVGLVGMIWLTLSYAVPFIIAMVSFVGHNLIHPDVGSVAFWESVAVVAVIAGEYAVIPLLAWRERRLRRIGALR